MALTAYADADHAGCQDTRRSTSGSAQFLGEKLVSWSSKKQRSTAISTTEAEYIAMCTLTSKHNDIRHHFIESKWKNEWFETLLRGNELSIADILHKSIAKRTVRISSTTTWDEEYDPRNSQTSSRRR
ncbi:copia protein [Tanacetum coccineum]